MPRQLWEENLTIPYKKHALYSQNKKFLWEYNNEIFEKRKDKPQIFKFILDISVECLRLYNEIQSHQDWKFIPATKKSGIEGFGYDPIFIPNGFEITFAKMTKQQKGTISHRGRAVSHLIKFLSVNY